jgi:hypothetical protein
MIKYTLLFNLFCFHLTLQSQQDYCSAQKSKFTNLFTQTNAGSIEESLMNKYDVKFYHLNLNVERTSTFVSGWVRSLVLFNTATDTFAFELNTTMIIDSVIEGNKNLSVTHIGNIGYAKSVNPFPSGGLADIVVYYHGTPPASGSSAIGNGFTSTTDASSGFRITYSLSQPYSAQEWWPCKQSLKDKIDSSYVFVTTDSSNRVGSNGLLKNIVPLGNKKRYEWKQYHPIDCYLISVAVGKYADYSFYANPLNTQPILIQNYIYDNPATLTTIKPIFDKTKGIIELYCKLFGPYAFADEKYGHCMAPLGGGMEHQTMTTIGAYNFSVVAHELGHQWFGDAVTCATWSDIWVNEGFATYTAYLAMQYLDTVNSISYMTSSHNTVTSAPDGSVWFTDTANVGRIFSNRLTYQKGSSIIHMIRYELNDDTLFFNILKEYIKRFKGSTASALDFKKVVEDISGKDFTVFFNQWFYGEGFPTYNVFWNQLGNRLNIITAQSTSLPTSIGFFTEPVQYKIKTDKGDTIIKINMKKSVEGIVFNIQGTVLSIEVDPSNWLLCKSFVVKDPNQLPLGMDGSFDRQLNAIIYPNPATNNITIQMNELPEDLNYTILDSSGRHVHNGKLKDKISQLDISSLAKGFYYVRIGETNPQVFKLVKQ